MTNQEAILALKGNGQLWAIGNAIEFLQIGNKTWKIAVIHQIIFTT